MILKGTTALITGSTGNIGAAIAKRLAMSGCRCICHYNTNKAVVDKLIAEIQKMGYKAGTVHADMGNPQSIEKLIEKFAAFENFRILINSASIFPRADIEKTDIDFIQKTMMVNFTGPLMLCKAFANVVRKQASKNETQRPIAKIVNLTDVSALRPWANYTAYCASKAALTSATKSLAKELAPDFTVNAVAPGTITPPRNESEKKVLLSKIPAGRFGYPDDIARAVEFLLENDYVTGQTLNVSGGKCI